MWAYSAKHADKTGRNLVEPRDKFQVFKSVTNLLQFTKKHSCPKIEAEKYDEESAGKTLYSCIQPQTLP